MVRIRNVLVYVLVMQCGWLLLPAVLYADIGGICVSAFEIGQRHYGPFDYLNSEHREKKLMVVEKHHFSQEVETLKSGLESSIGGDLDYTLKSFPNHHKALYSMIKYKLQSVEGGRVNIDSMECYFQRALEVNNRDAYVYQLNGIYLHRKKKYKEALGKYLQAINLEKNNSELYYNIGLVYYNLKEYSSALKYAKMAYELNYPLPALRDKLKKINIWK